MNHRWVASFTYGYATCAINPSGITRAESERIKILGLDAMKLFGFTATR